MTTDVPSQAGLQMVLTITCVPPQTSVFSHWHADVQFESGNGPVPMPVHVGSHDPVVVLAVQTVAAVCWQF